MNDYEQKRNALIAKAEKFASSSIDDRRHKRAGETNRQRWNRLYHGKMNELAREAGI
jgi:hypothetical protein